MGLSFKLHIKRVLCNRENCSTAHRSAETAHQLHQFLFFLQLGLYALNREQSPHCAPTACPRGSAGAASRAALYDSREDNARRQGNFIPSRVHYTPLPSPLCSPKEEYLLTKFISSIRGAAGSLPLGKERKIRAGFLCKHEPNPSFPRTGAGPSSEPSG